MNNSKDTNTLNNLDDLLAACEDAAEAFAFFDMVYPNAIHADTLREVANAFYVILNTANFNEATAVAAHNMGEAVIDAMGFGGAVGPLLNGAIWAETVVEQAYNAIYHSGLSEHDCDNELRDAFRSALRNAETATDAYETACATASELYVAARDAVVTLIAAAF